MNTLDKKYQDLLQDILDNGIHKSDRTGTGTISVFGRQIRHNMKQGFPALTTKKLAWKQVVSELLWFLTGQTNIAFLHKHNNHIWDGDYNKSGRTDGDLGPIYGKQWRKWDGKNGRIDQIDDLVKELKTNPDSRRLMVSAWNVGELDKMVLPPCHYGFQLYTRKTTRDEKIVHPGKYRAISLMWNQRSVDTFLGLPFNIASYGLLLEIIANEVDMIPDELIGNLGDVHLYSNHIEQAKEQIGREYTHQERDELLQQEMGRERYNKAVDELMPFGGGLSGYYEFYKIPYRTREPYRLPTLVMVTNPDLKFDEYVYDNLKLVNYQSHPTIKAPLSN
jgi:thymidylate synthase